MDSIFENSFIITQEIFLQQAKNPCGKTAKNKIKKWYTVNLIFILISNFGFIFTAITKQFEFMFVSIVTTLLFLFNLIFRLNFTYKKQFKQCLTQMGTNVWERTFIFSDNICVKEGSVKTFLEYSDIKNITLNDTDIHLWKNEEFILRIPNDSFIKGEYKDFIPFIKEKIKLAK